MGLPTRGWHRWLPTFKTDFLVPDTWLYGKISRNTRGMQIPVIMAALFTNFENVITPLIFTRIAQKPHKNGKNALLLRTPEKSSWSGTRTRAARMTHSGTYPFFFLHLKSVVGGGTDVSHFTPQLPSFIEKHKNDVHIYKLLLNFFTRLKWGPLTTLYMFGLRPITKKT